MAEPAAADPASTTIQQQCLGLLRKRDDTSQFVGLAMLSSISAHIDDPAFLSQCWQAIDQKFLNRLLNSLQTGKSREEAMDMIELAVNILHAFAKTLPNAQEEGSLIAKSDALIRVVGENVLSSLVVATVLQTLLVFSTGPKGASRILESPHLLTLLAVSMEHESGVAVLQHSFNSVRASPKLPQYLESFLPRLVSSLTSSKDVELRSNALAFLSDLLTRLPREVLPLASHEDWVQSTYNVIRSIILSAHSARDRSSSIMIAASLLHMYPEVPLFLPEPDSKKAFTPFFIQLVTIDICSTFPSLMEQLASPSYGILCHRIASDFDVLTAFLGYLASAEDEETLPLAPDVLLNIRAYLGETFGSTIEFLRDRWDAEESGTLGLEQGYEPGLPKSLTWKSTLGSFKRDLIVAGAMRALSLWLEMDESHRKEASGLMDVYTGLWDNDGVDVDYRPLICCALRGVLEERKGRTEFWKTSLWRMIWDDAKRAITEVLETGDGGDRAMSSDRRLELTNRASGGLQLLVEAVEADEGFSNREWEKEVEDLEERVLVSKDADMFEEVVYLKRALENA